MLIKYENGKNNLDKITADISLKQEALEGPTDPQNSINDEEDFLDQLFNNLFSTSNNSSSPKIESTLVSDIEYTATTNDPIPLTIAGEKNPESEMVEVESEKSSREQPKKTNFKTEKKAKEVEQIKLQKQQQLNFAKDQEAKKLESLNQKLLNIQQEKHNREIGEQKKLQKALNRQKSEDLKTLADQKKALKHQDLKILADQKKAQKELNIQKAEEDQRLAKLKKAENKLKQEIEIEKAKQNSKISGDDVNRSGDAVGSPIESFTNALDIKSSDKSQLKTNKDTPKKLTHPEIVQSYFRKAVEEGNLEGCKLYLSKGAKVNASNNLGYTALHTAAICENVKLAQFLIKNGADINSTGQCCYTVLHMAINTGNSKIVELLIENGVDTNILFNTGFTFMHMAAKFGNVDIAKLLCLKNDLLAKKCNEHDNTPLHIASEFNHTPMIQFLLDHGADINAVNKSFDSPLHIAIICGNDEAVRCLLNRGADIDILGRDNYNPLQLAIGACQIETLKLLLDQGLDPNKAGFEGMTALHTAFLIGDIEAIKLLLSYKSNINAIDNQGMTPLHHLWLQKELSYEIKHTITKEFEGRYDASIKDDSGHTFAFYAANIDPQEFNDISREHNSSSKDQEVCSQLDLYFNDLNDLPDPDFKFALVGGESYVDFDT